ncbi:MAG: hypothetical protein AAF748_01440 [Pseudomonadota bacterium]
MRLAFSVVLSLCCAPVALAADSVAYRFEWIGGGGFEMRGALSFSADLMGAQVVTEADVQCFVIEGFEAGAPIGRWALGQLSEETTWTLTFDPVTEAFVVFGDGAPMPQAWNMDGGGFNCGDGGFGFNIGNAAQDLCLDGQLLYQSQVSPGRPFPATRDDGFAFPGDACSGVMILSQAAR